jgi:outer membrane protein OmpA-like peptidoglycan-associated protein
MNPRSWLTTLAGCAVLTLAGCAPKTLVVLGSPPDGSPGAVQVSNSAGTVEIDRVNHGTVVGSPTEAPSAPAQVSGATIRRIFGAAMAAVPKRPEHFVLTFSAGSTELDPESASRLPEIAADIRDRASTWVSVVGHTDSTGNPSSNLALSAQRAAYVRDLLVALGAAPDVFDVTSFGDAVPLVPARPGVPEPRNRRVEVVVR